MATYLEDIFSNIEKSEIIRHSNSWKLSEFIRSGKNVFDVNEFATGDILCNVTFNSGSRIQVYSYDVVFLSKNGDIGIMNSIAANVLGVK